MDTAKGRLLTPNQLNAYLGKRPSACSANLGWSWMHVESWRNPTGHGEIDCPGGTHHELIVPLAGASATLRRFAGREYESESTLLDEFDLIPRGHENFWRWRGVGCEYASIDIAPAFLRQIAEEDDDVRSGGFELMPVAGGVDTCLQSIVVALIHEMEDQGPSGRLFAQSIMMALAVRILRRYTVQSPAIKATKGFSEKVLARIVDFIDANISRPCTLRELAVLAGCSPWAFCRRFKLTTGTTPHRFVLARRIARSKYLMSKTTKSLSQVALACGFSSHAHFASVFLRYTGRTPAAYRG